MHREHTHGHACGHEHDTNEGLHIHPVVSNLKTAFFLNVSFTLIELIGGLYTNSVAILSDAIHDLGDSIAIGSSLWMEKLSNKGRTTSFTYGYKRFSPLAALISSGILLGGSIMILFHALPRLLDPQPVHASGMFWMAILGVGFNGLAVLKLKRSHNSVNQRAVMLHLMEDALGWIAVLIGSVIISFTDWFWIDPLLSILIAGFIIFNATRTLRDVLKIFLQVAPPGVDQNRIVNELQDLPHVEGVHDFHSWTLDGNTNVATMHLVVDESATVEDQRELRQAALRVLGKHNIHHPTLHLEDRNENCALVDC